MATLRKLGRPTDHRKAMLRNQVTSLLKHGRIETTVNKAKETQRMAEKNDYPCQKRGGFTR